MSTVLKALLSDTYCFVVLRIADKLRRLLNFWEAHRGPFWKLELIFEIVKCRANSLSRFFLFYFHSDNDYRLPSIAFTYTYCIRSVMLSLTYSGNLELIGQLRREVCANAYTIFSEATRPDLVLHYHSLIMQMRFNYF